MPPAGLPSSWHRVLGGTSLLLLLSVSLRTAVAERPWSRSILDKAQSSEHKSTANVASMTDVDLQTLAGDLDDMAKKVHAVQQHRHASHASTGPTSVRSNASVYQNTSSSSAASRAASALNEASARASAGTKATETQILKEALNVAVKALMNQATEAPTPDNNKDEPDDKTPGDKVVDDPELQKWARALPESQTRKLMKSNVFRVPDEPKELTAKERAGRQEEFDKLKAKFEKITPDFKKVVGPVWNAIKREDIRTDKDAQEAIESAISMNKRKDGKSVEEFVDNHVDDMKDFASKAKDAYVEHTKEVFKEVKATPKKELTKLKEDSPSEVDKDIALVETVEDAMSGGEAPGGSAADVGESPQ